MSDVQKGFRLGWIHSLDAVTKYGAAAVRRGWVDDDPALAPLVLIVDDGMPETGGPYSDPSENVIRALIHERRQSAAWRAHETGARPR